MKASMGFIYAGLVLVLAGSLAGCTGTFVTLPPDPSETPTANISPSPLPSQTRTFTSEPTSSPTATEIIAPSPTQTVVPNGGTPILRFVFPTPGAPPKSAWRPALYDVPWALTPFDHFYFARPIAADEVNWPLADYRYGAVWPGLSNVFHTGIDIDAPKGTPVLAAAAGKVVWVGYGLVNSRTNLDDPYGLAIVIKHDFGYQGERLETVYAHLSEADVVLDQEINAGQKIGLVGNTGLTTGPHLHFEVRVEYSNYYYTTRNPELWLVPPQGWGILVGRIMKNSWTSLYAQDVYVRSLANEETWLVRTYADSQALYEDDYYKENLVLSDLPAGDYAVSFSVGGRYYRTVISIHPGMVTFLSFDAIHFFSTALPVTPTVDFLSATTPSNP